MFIVGKNRFPQFLTTFRHDPETLTKPKLTPEPKKARRTEKRGQKKGVSLYHGPFLIFKP